MMRYKRGQAALILILLTAVGLIFFAITLNWGRIAQIKTVTLSAATNAASGTVSSLASYGEKVLYTTLGGQAKKCSNSGILGAIFAVILAIIAVILAIIPGLQAPAGALFVAAVSLVLAVANLLLQVLVIQPGLTSMWNKLQANLPPMEQFVEHGVQTGVQNSITDQVKVTDIFDLNNNGSQGFVGGRPDDVIDRFGIYYTDRLRLIQRPQGSDLDDLHNFISGLKDLNAVLVQPCEVKCNCSDPKCTDARCADPHCNPCCIPLKDINGNRQRPAGCSVDPVPTECANTSIWTHATTYPYAYNPVYPNYVSGSDFLAKIGHDAELRSPNPIVDDPFDPNKADAKGLYSYLWDMDVLPTDPNRNAVAGDALVRVSDGVTVIAGFGLADNVCAADPAYNPPTSFDWKKGIDVYCSTTWPYDSNCWKQQNTTCTQTVNGTPGFVSSCNSCHAGTEKYWPEDSVDDVIYGLREFYMWSKQMSAQDVAQLKIQLDLWYPDALVWFGTNCTTGSGPTCYDGGGRLRVYRDRLGLWMALLGNWLNATTYTDPNAWCLPPTSTGFGADEINYINAHSTGWGTLDSVTACFDYNIGNDVKFNTCVNDVNIEIGSANAAVAACPTCPAPSLNLPASCTNLPRAASGTTAPPFDWASGAHGNDYLWWVANNYNLSLIQKAQFAQRAAFLRGMQNKAVNARGVIATFKAKLDYFLDGGPGPAPVQSLFDAPNNLSTSASSHLNNYIVYGWKDDPLKNPADLWHIVYAEMNAPGNCTNDSGFDCQQNRLPWVRSYTKGFLGMTRCYELTDAHGQVKATIKRWDQDHYSSIDFHNKSHLWQGLFRKPGSAPAHGVSGDLSADIFTACGGGLGLSQATKDALDREEMPNKEKEDILNGAFMLNSKSGTCWSLIEPLLNKNAIVTDICAEYFLNFFNGGDHVDLRFKSCN